MIRTVVNQIHLYQRKIVIIAPPYSSIEQPIHVGIFDLLIKHNCNIEPKLDLCFIESEFSEDDAIRLQLVNDDGELTTKGFTNVYKAIKDEMNLKHKGEMNLKHKASSPNYCRNSYNR